MNIHIICPFYRKTLLPTLLKYLEPENIIWHPICDHIDIQAFDINHLPLWVQPIICAPFLATDMCYRKINDFLDIGTIIDSDYYGFMGDDDMYEPGFFDTIRQQTARILVYSCYRGDTTPVIEEAEQHPSNPLIIRTIDDIQVGRVGLGMYIIKGEILRQTRFGNNHKWDDGYFAVNLKERWPGEIKILSDLFVFGNYFEPGRFTSKNNFIKNTWELPVIV